MTVEINLFWKLSNGESGSEDLAPAQYFDSSESDYSVDSVSRHDHGFEYTPYDRNQVVQTVLTIRDVGRRTRVISEAFWNEGKNRVIERRDEGDEPYWEIIVESRMMESTSVEILRIGRDEIGSATPLSHVFLTLDADGSESQQKVFPRE